MKELEGTRVLLVDDQPYMLESLRLILSKEGASVTTAPSGETALEAIKAERFDVALTDIKMPGISGIELLERGKATDPRLVFIMLTGYGTIESAVEAMSKGAYHYLTKPFNASEILITVQRALRERSLLEENRQLRQQIDKKYSFGNILFKSEKMRKVCHLIEKVAPTRASVLVLGESGTGKELIARAIHQQSPRRDKRFVAINTAALPETLLEAELFGYKKGAFTGADADKRGLFVEADGGTLFLDEVSSMAPPFQSKLLRVLQEGEVVPVGDTKLIRVDVRILSASNVDLKKATEQGNFREDLYYRLNVIEVSVPPLRERLEDIPLLATHFVEHYCKEQGMPSREISPEAMKVLMTYSWPGNVRELENVIQRAVFIADEERIGPAEIVLRSSADFYQEKEGNLFDLPYHEAKARASEIFQSRYVRLLLERYNNNISMAAKKSGITRAALYKILKNLNMH